MTGHTPWNSMKARKTLGPQIDAAAFRIGQNPELEALQARLLTLEASAAEQLAHPLLFALEPDRTELMHTASQRLFSHFSGTVAEVMLLITQAMTGTSMPMFLKPASLLGFGLLSFEDQEFKGGTTKRTWLLHFVSTAGDGWRIIRYPGIEPITLLDTAAEATDSITMSLDRMVRAATLQLEVNEADPGLHILRKALGFADE